MEKIFTAKTFEEAKALAAQEAGLDESKITFEVIEQPKKGIFGFTKGEFKVQAVWGENAEKASGAVVGAQNDDCANEGVKVKAACAYLEKVIKALGVENFEVKVVHESDGSIVLDIVGEHLGVAIGRRGETLDSLQYLAILASNRNDEPYSRIIVDCNGYREKRRETLESLAERTAQKVLRQGRRITLEPMNPYERRIIHSKVSEIEGVTSHSTGDEPFRKVVISSIAKPTFNRSGGFDKRPERSGDRNDRRSGGDKRGGRRTTGGSSERSYKSSAGFSTSFEREYKRERADETPNGYAGEFSKETVETEKNAKLYGKIEL